jgi:hypothetical protein
MFNPGTGRFLSIDPRSPDGVDLLYEHPFVYARNNPVNLTDPSGLQPAGLYLPTPGPGDPVPFSSGTTYRCKAIVRIGDCILTQDIEIRGRAWRFFLNGKINDLGEHFVEVQLKVDYKNKVLSCPCRPDVKEPNSTTYFGIRLQYGVFIRPDLDGFATEFKPTSCENFVEEFSSGASKLTPKPKGGPR